MRVFISGSKVLKDSIGDGRLPDTVYSKINSLMADGAEIIIGDCYGADTLVQRYLYEKQYRNVTVYVSGNKNGTRNNIGNWEEKHFGVHNTSNGYGMRIEKDLHMAEDADCGLALWDGESKGTFVNMVCLAAQGKTCSTYFLNEQKWVDISSLDELERYLNQHYGWQDEDIDKVLAICGFSEEMRNYLVTEHLISAFDLIDIVCQAPVSLEEKIRTLNFLGRENNILKHDVMKAAAQKKKMVKNGIF